MNKLEVRWTFQFNKDYKNAIKRNLNINLLDDVIRILQNGETLDSSYKDHALSGNWQSFRECHILPNWLLIYKIENNLLVLTLARTGTHSDLFNK